MPQKKTNSIGRSITNNLVSPRTCSSTAHTVCQTANKHQQLPTTSSSTTGTVSKSACKPPGTSHTLEPSSCNTKTNKKKHAIWQEFTMNEEGALVMMSVEDLGVATSIRRRKPAKKTTPPPKSTATQQEIVLEDNFDSSKWTEQNKKMQNKPQRRPEAATVTATLKRSRTQARTKPHDVMKKTSPSREVKTVSKTRRQTTAHNSPCSPSLKRLQTKKLTRNVSRTNLSSRKPENSPVNFKKLLLTWEELSTRNLTPAVEERTRLGNFVDSQ
jgi:hypothetical protein